MESKKRSKDPFYFPGDSTGILLIHGYTGSPAEMRFLGERLAHQGWTVLGLCLSGHGASSPEIGHTSWEDWVRDAESGIKDLRASCQRVVGIGLSLGGLIALYMASRGKLDGVIAMNAPMDRCSQESVKPVHHIMSLVGKELDQITCPTLLMQSRQDETVNPESVIRIQERIYRVHPTVIFFEKSSHILPLGPERKNVVAETVDFIQSHKL